MRLYKPIIQQIHIVYKEVDETLLNNDLFIAPLKFMLIL